MPSLFSFYFSVFSKFYIMSLHAFYTYEKHIYKNEHGFETRILTLGVTVFINVRGNTGKSGKPHKSFLKAYFELYSVMSTVESRRT